MFVIIVPSFAALGAVLGDVFVYRVANTALFWNSRAPITAVAFPIEDTHSGKGGPAVFIASQGSRQALSVSSQDLVLIAGAAQLNGSQEFCIPLRHQKEGEAERVWRPKNVRTSFKGITITACPDAVR